MPLERSVFFPPFCLDLANERLWRLAQPIPLRPKTFAVLRCFVEHPGQLLTKEALFEAVWSETAVSDVVLKVCIRELRHTLGDNARNPQFIETVHGRGYRFIGSVIEAPQSEVQQDISRRMARPPASWSYQWPHRRGAWPYCRTGSGNRGFASVSRQGMERRTPDSLCDRRGGVGEDHGR